DKRYHHDSVWGEANGFSHLRSSLFKPFLTIPIENGKPILGTWQQVVLINFDNREREREVIVKVFGK
ncbi:MAG TPA: YjbQ family protein, partial [bacterium]|nr:YjbQ family protein [bacterium]